MARTGLDAELGVPGKGDANLLEDHYEQLMALASFDTNAFAMAAQAKWDLERAKHTSVVNGEGGALSCVCVCACFIVFVEWRASPM